MMREMETLGLSGKIGSDLIITTIYWYHNHRIISSVISER